MKKVILITSALLMVVSGVAAVSAYESHLINVTAHVENALAVDTAAIDFGTMFPEEFLVQHRDINLSTSAIAEKPVDPEDPQPGDLDYVEVQAYAEWKLDPAADTTADPNHVPDVIGTDGKDYYAWMGECLFVGFDVSDPNLDGDDFVNVGAALAVPPSAQAILSTFKLDGVTTVQLAVALDTPVFAGYYNALTDVDLKQNGLSVPSWIIPKTDPRWIPGGVDLGLDLKVQVIDIVRVD